MPEGKPGGSRVGLDETTDTLIVKTCKILKENGRNWRSKQAKNKQNRSKQQANV